MYLKKYWLHDQMHALTMESVPLDHGQIAKNLEICLRRLNIVAIFGMYWSPFKEELHIKKYRKIPKFKGFNVWVLFLNKNSL